MIDPVKAGAELYIRALELEVKREYKEAFVLFKQCRECGYADAAECAFHCAWCLELLGNDNEEAKCYYHLAAAETASVELKINAQFRAAWLDLQKGLLEEVERLLTDTLRIAEMHNINNTTTMHSEYWLAACLEASGQYIAALKHFTNVERIADEALKIEVLCREIVCFSAIGKFATALDVVRRYLEISPRPENEIRYRQIYELVMQEKTSIEAGLLSA